MSAFARPLPSLGICSVLAAACVGVEAPDEAPALALHDHHVHVLSQQLVDDWKSLGVPFSRPDEAYTSPAGLFAASDPAAAEGALPLGGVVLVPMAHFYANAELRGALELDLEAEQARVRAENEHVARVAERWGDRAVALVSVDFTRPYARREAERALADGAVGLKLHLGSASPDLTDPAVLADLADWFAWAERDDFGVLLHLDPQRRGLTQADVTHFLEGVFGPVPDLRVVIAHLGGSGGFGDWTQSVLAAITAWLEAEARAGRLRPHVLVDVSAALLAAPSEGVPATTPEEAAALAPALRRLGLERVLFASDAPVFDPWDTWELLLDRTDLTPSEQARILTNRAVW